MSQKCGRTSCHERRSAERTERSSIVITGPTSDHSVKTTTPGTTNRAKPSERRERQHDVGRDEPAQRKHVPDLGNAEVGMPVQVGADDLVEDARVHDDTDHREHRGGGRRDGRRRRGATRDDRSRARLRAHRWPRRSRTRRTPCRRPARTVLDRCAAPPRPRRTRGRPAPPSTRPHRIERATDHAGTLTRLSPGAVDHTPRLGAKPGRETRSTPSTRCRAAYPKRQSARSRSWSVVRGSTVR